MLALDADDLADLADTIVVSPRPPSIGTAMLGLRYGTRTYGSASLPPLFLLRPSVSTAQAWVTRWFTRANAVLWSTGPLRPDASLPLSGGGRGEAPEPSDPLIATPAWCVAGRHVSVYTVVAPTAATTVALRAIATEIRERASGTLVDTTDLACHLVVWRADAASVTIELNASRDVNEGIEFALGTIDDFAESGPDPDELTEAIADIEDWAMPRDNAEAVAALLARDELLLERPQSIDQYLGDIATVTAAQVASAAKQMRDAMLAAVPDGAEIVDPSFTEVDPADTPVDGDRYPRLADSGDPDAADVLLVGAEGVSMTMYDVALTVRYADCAAVVRYTDDALTLYATNGASIDVVAAEWRDGTDALAAIEAAVPPELVIANPRPITPV